MPDESAALIWCFCGRFEGHSHAWDARHCPAAGPVAGQHAARAHITAAEVDAEIRAAWKRGYDEGLYTGMQP